MDTDELARDLDLAVGDGQLGVVFQPQIALDSGRIVAVEGLCRWTHPTRGPIAPDRFIPVAEATGAIHAIGQFMIDACIGAADRWSAASARIEISVNVSPVQLTASFAKNLRDRWRRRGLPADSLTLEITESLPVPHLAASIRRLEALREVGIGISLDDYGTGHASLDQLERLPVTEVKLDRSLIHGQASQPSDVADFVAFAHERELRVVAEGIENHDQLRFARCVGCDRAQGYLLGSPMTEGRIGELLIA